MTTPRPKYEHKRSCAKSAMLLSQNEAKKSLGSPERRRTEFFRVREDEIELGYQQFFGVECSSGRNIATRKRDARGGGFKTFKWRRRWLRASRENDSDQNSDLAFNRNVQFSQALIAGLNARRNPDSHLGLGYVSSTRVISGRNSSQNRILNFVSVFFLSPLVGRLAQITVKPAHEDRRRKKKNESQCFKMINGQISWWGWGKYEKR